MPGIVRTCLALLLCLALAPLAPAAPEPAPASPSAPVPRRAEPRPVLVGLASGGIAGSYARLAADLAAVLDAPDLRVLPMLGRGSVQNLRDLRDIAVIDLALVQADVLDHLRTDPELAELVRRLQIVAKLHNEEFHLLVRGHITRLGDLTGTRVNVDVPGSGTAITAEAVFEALPLPLRVERTYYDQLTALEKLRAGEISALAFVAGKPAPLFQRVRPEDDLHFLPIALPPALLGRYLPARLTKTDYPNLIVSGDEIQTVAVGALLVAQTPRKRAQARKLELFTTRFFEHFEAFRQAGRHPKWREVSIAAQVPDWPRLKAAEAWLTANPDKVRSYAELAARAAAKAEAARLEAAKAEAARLEAEKAEAARKAEVVRVEAEKTEAARKAEVARVEAEKAEAARVEAEKAEAARKAEVARIEAEQAEAARKAEAARVEAEQAAAARRRAEAEKAEADKAEAARRAEAEKAEAEKAEAARQAEAARREAEKAEAARKTEAAKAEAARAEAARKAEAARAEATTRAEAARKAEAARAEADQAEAARKAEAARSETDQAEAARKAEAAREAADKAEAERSGAELLPPAPPPDQETGTHP